MASLSYCIKWYTYKVFVNGVGGTAAAIVATGIIASVYDFLLG